MRNMLRGNLEARKGVFTEEVVLYPGMASERTVKPSKKEVRLSPKEKHFEDYQDEWKFPDCAD